MRVLIVLLAMVLSACATTPDANYQAYLNASDTAEQRSVIAHNAIADTAACNGDATCVVAVKGFAALAYQGSGSNKGQLQQYVRQPSAWEKFGLGALNILAPLSQAYVALDAGRNNVDIARIGADREVRVTEAWAGTTVGVAQVFADLPPSTSVTVGRDWVSGYQHIGDTVGRDQIAGDQHIGDAIGRDVIGGDRIDNSGNIGNDNRITSPGPFENGDDCIGDHCQGDGDINPPPEPDPVPGG